MIHWKFIFIVSKRAYYVNTWWRNFLLHLNDIKRLTTFCLIYENLFRRSKRLFLTRFATRRKLLSLTLRTVSSISYYLAKICAPLGKMKWLLFYHFDVWLQAGKRDNYKWLLSHWEGKKHMVARVHLIFRITAMLLQQFWHAFYRLKYDD